MLTRLVCIFSILTFLCSSVIEVQEFDYSNAQDNVSSFSLETHCGTCNDVGCEDNQGCCQSMCSCAPTLLIDLNYSTLVSTLTSRSKVLLYLYSKYHSPFLDPALKPPLFS